MDIVILTTILMIFMAIGGSIYFAQTRSKGAAIGYAIYVCVIIGMFIVGAIAINT